MVRDAPPPPIARRFAPVLAAGSALLALSAAAAAAQPPAAPTREQVEQVRPPPEEGQRARLTIEGGVEHAPCALDRPDYANIRFTLNEAVFDDLKGLPAEALRPAFAPYLGQENNIAVVCAIRDRAATILRDAGYLAAVEVPEQRIEGGRVHFTVLMARLVGLQVRGDAGRSERIIARYLGKLTEREVFNRFDAERYLLLAGDLPGYDVRLALRSAGRARGEVIGEVIVTRQGPIVEATVQDLGSHALGRWGALARAQFYGLTGLGDRTTLAFFTTLDAHEQQTAQLGHDFRIGGEGLALGGQLTYSWASPDLGDPLVHIDSHTLFATLEASYPLVRRQARTLRAGGGIDLIDQDIRFNNIPLNRDRLRVAFARLSADAIGLAAGDPRYTPAAPVWRAGGSIEARQGLDLFGATTPCGATLAACLLPGVVPPTRLEGDPTAFVLRGSLYGEVRPRPRLTFSLAARAQYSPHPLLSFEEFSAGNYSEGRGYDPGALLGDSGIGVQAELRYGSTSPRAENRAAAEPYVFFDHAIVWNQDRLFGLGRQSLSSIGGGVRAAVGDRVRFDALIAVPLDRLAFQPHRGDPRFLISLTTRFQPRRPR